MAGGVLPPPSSSPPLPPQTSAQQPSSTSPSKLPGPGTSPVDSFPFFPPSVMCPSSLTLGWRKTPLGWTTAQHLYLGTLRKQSQVCGQSVPRLSLPIIPGVSTLTDGVVLQVGQQLVLHPDASSVVGSEADHPPPPRGGTLSGPSRAGLVLWADSCVSPMPPPQQQDPQSTARARRHRTYRVPRRGFETSCRTGTWRGIPAWPKVRPCVVVVLLLLCCC